MSRYPNNINVLATRWEHGWELEIAPDEHTQVRLLKDARQQVIDYLDTVESEINHAKWEINIIPELGRLGEEVNAARRAVEEVSLAQVEAAKMSRRVTKKLRAAGISVKDCATLMNVSKSRISQLANA